MVQEASNDGVHTLLQALSAVPECRGRQGRDHPLTALLSGLVVGFAAGNNTLKAVVLFLRERPALRRELGFTSQFSPSQSTYHRLLSKLALGPLRDALSTWLMELARRRGAKAAAIDGKALRGTAHHVLHVFAQDVHQLLDLFEVDQKRNEDSALREQLGALCERYPFIEIFTLDAGFASRPLLEALGGQGKRALFQVKGNQKETLYRLERWFSKLPKTSPAVVTRKKKSRVVVERSYWVAKAPVDIRELWPEAVQIIVCRTRHLPRHPSYGAPKEETHYYILNGYPGARALSAKRLAALVRGHWSIENRLHHVKDRTYREDEQRARCGAVVLCWLRTTALTLLDVAEKKRGGKRRRYMPEQRSYYGAHPEEAAGLMRRI